MFTILYLLAVTLHGADGLLFIAMKLLYYCQTFSSSFFFFPFSGQRSEDHGTDCVGAPVQ